MRYKIYTVIICKFQCINYATLSKVVKHEMYILHIPVVRGVAKGVCPQWSIEWIF